VIADQDVSSMNRMGGKEGLHDERVIMKIPRPGTTARREKRCELTVVSRGVLGRCSVSVDF